MSLPESLRQRTTMSQNTSNNTAAPNISIGEERKGTGLSVQAMERASPQQTGSVRKLRVPFLYTMLPHFLQQVVLKVSCFAFLRPTWQSRYLIVLGSYLYKFKGNDSPNVLHQQPNGSPVRLDNLNVHLVTTRSGHDDYDALMATKLLNVRGNGSCVFCVATFRKKYYYACSNHEEALLWVNTLREAGEECVRRTMGHASKDSYPHNWTYYDSLGDDLANRKERIRTRLQQSNLRELELSNFSEGGPLPRGYYG